MVRWSGLSKKGQCAFNRSPILRVTFDPVAALVVITAAGRSRLAPFWCKRFTEIQIWRGYGSQGSDEAAGDDARGSSTCKGDGAFHFGARHKRDRERQSGKRGSEAKRGRFVPDRG